MLTSALLADVDVKKSQLELRNITLRGAIYNCGILIVLSLWIGIVLFMAEEEQ